VKPAERRNSAHLVVDCIPAYHRISAVFSGGPWSITARPLPPERATFATAGAFSLTTLHQALISCVSIAAAMAAQIFIIDASDGIAADAHKRYVVLGARCPSSRPNAMGLTPSARRQRAKECRQISNLTSSRPQPCAGDHARVKFAYAYFRELGDDELADRLPIAA